MDVMIFYLGDDSINLILLNGHDDTCDEGRGRILKEKKIVFNELFD
jgi:hypothetical protein